MGDFFEVLCESGDRFRYSYSDYSWQFASKEGQPDVLDKNQVEILQIANDEMIHHINQVIRVGDVCEDSLLQFPMKERRMTLCPRCGYQEYENS